MLNQTQSIPSLVPQGDDINLDGDSVEKTLIGFGGLYSVSLDGNNENNPFTGGQSCPSGYQAIQVLGSPEEDSAVYSCQKTLAEEELPIYEFGGMFGSYEGGVYDNPTTGFQSCPADFNSYRILGASSRDSNLYYCVRRSSPSITSHFGFGGFLGLGRDLEYSSVVNQTSLCDSSYIEFRTYGSSNLDWPLSFCAKELTDDVSFHSRNSPPEIFFYPEFDRGLAAFGGMYSLRGSVDNSYPNPATDDFSCPEGYLAEKIYGVTSGYDPDLYVCYKPDQGSFETAVYDFGGMYGMGRYSNYKNPHTNALSCPSGFTATKVVGLYDYDYGLFMCHRPQKPDVPTPYSFGGFYSEQTDANLYFNPLTGARSCPDAHDSYQILGTGGLDWPLFACDSEIEAPE